MKGRLPTNNKLGIGLMTATAMLFGLQDGISRHLAFEHNVFMVVMIRYWFFAAFVLALATLRHGGIARVASTRRPLLQIVRGLLLAAEICIFTFAMVNLGLVGSHAIFACCPLIIAALSGPFLKEKVGWRRWSAIIVGFAGVLVILDPGGSLYSPFALLALAATLMFAAYSLLTRYVANWDSAETSHFWVGIAGAAGITVVGLTSLEPMPAADWVWMATLCATAVAGHFLLIKCYEVSEASIVQPFSYLHLVFASAIGLAVFGETLTQNMVVGAALVISAGLFVFWRQAKKKGTRRATNRS